MIIPPRADGFLRLMLSELLKTLSHPSIDLGRGPFDVKRVLFYTSSIRMHCKSVKKVMCRIIERRQIFLTDWSRKFDVRYFFKNQVIAR